MQGVQAVAALQLKQPPITIKDKMQKMNISMDTWKVGTWTKTDLTVRKAQHRVKSLHKEAHSMDFDAVCTYAARHMRKIRGEQRIYPETAVPAERGAGADPLPRPAGCPLCWSFFWPGKSPPLQGCLLQPLGSLKVQPLIQTWTSPRASTSSSSSLVIRPRRWRPPARPLPRHRTPPGCSKRSRCRVMAEPKTQTTNSRSDEYWSKDYLLILSVSLHLLLRWMDQTILPTQSQLIPNCQNLQTYNQS